jgi:two-component system, response regulator
MPSVSQAVTDNRPERREILMVEDSTTDAELALRAFKLADFANPVTVVARGEQGLDYLFGTGTFAARGPTRPHLILLDLGLPSMTGVDFLQRVRADGRTRDIPVVVLSLSERNADVAACIQLGAEAYIVKPVNFENFTRITVGLKLRLTLVAPPGPGSLGGWVLSGACAVPHMRSPGGNSVAAGKPESS